jgi:hypothetical protein
MVNFPLQPGGIDKLFIFVLIQQISGRLDVCLKCRAVLPQIVEQTNKRPVCEQAKFPGQLRSKLAYAPKMRFE